MMMSVEVVEFGQLDLFLWVRFQDHKNTSSCPNLNHREPSETVNDVLTRPHLALLRFVFCWVIQPKIESTTEVTVRASSENGFVPEWLSGVVSKSRDGSQLLAPTQILTMETIEKKPDVSHSYQVELFSLPGQEFSLPCNSSHVRHLVCESRLKSPSPLTVFQKKENFFPPQFDAHKTLKTSCDKNFPPLPPAPGGVSS